MELERFGHDEDTTRPDCELEHEDGGCGSSYQTQETKKNRTCGETGVRVAKRESIVVQVVVAIVALMTSAVERHRRPVEWTLSEKGSNSTDGKNSYRKSAGKLETDTRQM